MKIHFSLILMALLLGFLPRAAFAVYDKAYVGDTVEYRAKYEDTFVYIARDYGLGYVEMRAANPGIDPWVPGAGTKLTLPTRHLLPDAPREGLVINLPEMRLYAFVHGDDAPESFPLGIGREGLDTPLGATKVIRKVEGPVWRPTARMRREKPELKEVVPPGPDNPMGTHALYLGWPQYAIHGTDRPFGIGRRVSSGCIRLYPEDIIRVYEIAPVGTRVTVVDQPIKVGWIDDELFIEAHQTVEQSVDMEETGQISAPKLTDKDMERIIKAAGEYKDRLRWPAIRTAVRERRGYPVAIARRPRLQVENETPSDEENAASEAMAADVKVSKEEIKQSMEELYGDGAAAGEVHPEAKTVYGVDTFSTLNP
jgi:L,D-transpeptidase ErfK/SrfK